MDPGFRRDDEKRLMDTARDPAFDDCVADVAGIFRMVIGVNTLGCVHRHALAMAGYDERFISSLYGLAAIAIYIPVGGV
jgi:hypothetical protein